jgi:integrase
MKQPQVDLIDDLAEEWLQTAGFRGATPETLSFYRYAKKQLLEFCTEHEIAEPQQLTRRHIDRIGFLLRQRVKPRTADSYVRTMGYFLNWLKENGYECPAAGYKRPDVPDPEVVTLASDQVDRLIQAAEGERDRLILEILARSALRASEVCRLRTTDVVRQGSRHFLHVQGKGARERLAPVTPTMYRRLRAWRDQLRPECSTDRLFVSERRDWRVADYAPLTRSGILRVVKNAAKRAGISERVYSHLLRHTFTTEALRRRIGDLQAITILGHADSRMLRKHYAHLQAQDAYDAFMQTMGRS